MGDDVKLNYISPRMNGVQVGFSYGAGCQENENASDPARRKAMTTSLLGCCGLNFHPTLRGWLGLTFSLGHQQPLGKAAK